MLPTYLMAIFAMSFAAASAKTLFYLIDRFDSTFKDIEPTASAPEQYAA
jgi:hypothetical protein